MRASVSLFSLSIRPISPQSARLAAVAAFHPALLVLPFACARCGRAVCGRLCPLSAGDAGEAAARHLRPAGPMAGGRSRGCGRVAYSPDGVPSGAALSRRWWLVRPAVERAAANPSLHVGLCPRVDARWASFGLAVLPALPVPRERDRAGKAPSLSSPAKDVSAWCCGCWRRLTGFPARGSLPACG